MFMFAAATLYAVYKAVSPFLEERRDQLRSELLESELAQIEELVARKASLLQNLRDLEFDYETGKLSEEDYDRLKRQHEREAVKVMKKLDELRGEDRRDDIDEAIEARLEQLRAERDELDVSDESRTSGEDKREATGDEASVDETPSSGRHCPECDRPLPRDAQFCSGCGLELDALECPDCGRELAADAQFCSGCGHELEDDSSETAPETEAGSAPPDEPSDEDIDADHAEDSEPPPPATSETEPRSQATG